MAVETQERSPFSPLLLEKLPTLLPTLYERLQAINPVKLRSTDFALLEFASKRRYFNDLERKVESMHEQITLLNHLLIDHEDLLSALYGKRKFGALLSYLQLMESSSRKPPEGQQVRFDWTDHPTVISLLEEFITFLQQSGMRIEVSRDKELSDISDRVINLCNILFERNPVLYKQATSLERRLLLRARPVLSRLEIHDIEVLVQLLKNVLGINTFSEQQKEDIKVVLQAVRRFRESLSTTGEYSEQIHLETSRALLAFIDRDDKETGDTMETR